MKMTVRELLEVLDATKKNEMPDELKLRWINDVEGRVQCEIWKKSPELFKRVLSDEDILSVPDPYCSMYLLFLVSMIEFAEGNYGDYARLSIEFEKNLELYAKWYIRNAQN